MIAKIAVEGLIYSIDKPYSYAVPPATVLRPGQRVSVPFGRGNRVSEGMVLSVEEGEREGLKQILAVLDPEPVMTEGQLRLAAFVRERREASDLGYVSTVRIYSCGDCSGCGLSARCLRRGQEKRVIYVNPHRDRLRKKAAERLTSDEGVVLGRRRATDVETVFGDVKRNWGFRRFTLRGIEKVAHEWRLLMMGHNIRKLTRKIAEAGANPALAAAAP